MKKLNKKGFTLIGLLAVIVVLAIVMVIAVTSILNTTGSAAKNSFIQSANTIADFAKKQNQLYVADGTGSANETCYTKWAKNGGTSLTSGFNDESEASTCWGVNTNDYDLNASEMTIDGNGVVKLTLCPKTDGRFDNITGNSSDAILKISGSVACYTVKK